MSFSDASAGSCRIKSKGHIVGHTLWRGWAATCVFLKLERFKEKKAVSNFPELIEQIKGNFARCHYFFILCIMGWGLVSKSSSSRGFQDIEMRVPKLFNTNLAIKMMEFWWYCLSKANRQRSDFQVLSLNKQAHENNNSSADRPAILSNQRGSFQTFMTNFLVCSLV